MEYLLILIIHNSVKAIIIIVNIVLLFIIFLKHVGTMK